MSSKILLRRGTAAQWSSANPILGIGELGIETDTLKIKIGNGTSTWTQLTSYANVTPSQLTSEINNLISAAPATLDTLNELAAAINNDASFSTTVNNLLTGKVSKSGGDTITASTSSTVGLIIKAAASQTANIVEFQLASSAQPYFFMTPAGNGIFYTALSVNQSNSGSVGANNGIGAFEVKGTSFMRPTSATGTVLIARGAASQTADLQQWQNSAGTVLASVSADGFLNTPLITQTGANAYITFGSGGNPGFVVTGGAAVPLARFLSGNAASIALQVRGAASQTANLQEWQTSAGDVKSYIQSDGRFVSTLPIRTTSVGAVGVIDQTIGQFTIFPDSATRVGLGIKGAASQTANFQEWQNSSGSVLASISSNGAFATAQGIVATGNYASSFGGGVIGGVIVTVKANSASNKALVIQGAASQTANLQEWQNSSGTVLSKIDSKGVLTSNVAFGDFWGPVWETVTAGSNDQGWKKLVVISLPDNNYSGIQFKIDINNAVTNFGSSAYPEKSTYTVAATRAGGALNDSVSMVLTGPEGDKYIRGMKLSNGTYEIQFRQPADWTEVVVRVQPISAQPYLRGLSDLYTFYPMSAGGTAASTGGTVYTPVLGGTDKFSFLSAQSFAKIGGTSSQFLKADGSIDASTYFTTAMPYVAGHHAEGRYLASAALMNDLGNARLRGSTFTFTNVSPTNAQIDTMFDGTAGVVVFTTSAITFPVVIEFTLPRTLQYGATVGVGFGNATWRANSVKIEAFSNGAWVTCIDTTTNTSEDVLANIPGSNATPGTTKLKYTFANPNSSQFRICHLWGFNYNSDMWTQLQMPRAGGIMYGSLTVQGYTQTLGTTDVVQSLVRGISGQTSNLAEWKNSAGTTLVSIAPDGTSLFGNLNTTTGTHKVYGALEVLNGPSGNSSTSVFGFGGSANTTFTIGIKNTDNANNRNWQLQAGGGNFAGQAGNYIGEGGLLFNENNPNDSSTIGRGGFRRGGQFALGGLNTHSASLSITPLSTSTIGQVIRANASQTASLQEWQDSAGTVISKIDSSGQNFWTYSIRPQATPSSGAFIQLDSNQVRVTQSTAGAVAFIVKGAASQTASLQEWQDSTGAPVATMSPNGQLRLYSVYNIGSFNNSQVNMLSTGTQITSNVASNIILSVKAATSQTADLTQWQNSAGTVLTQVTTNGSILINDAALRINVPSSYGAIRLQIGTDNATVIGQVIRGAASQTANLQEWQNSAGTVLVSIGNTGNITLGSSLGINMSGAYAGIYGAGGEWGLYREGAVAKFVAPTDMYLQSAYGGTILAAMPTKITNSTAASVGLIVKGAASQTANLQEWQDSAGAVLASISPSLSSVVTLKFTEAYSFKINWGSRDIFSTASGHLTVTPYDDSRKVLVVKGYGAQTANLQEWQDSSGSVLARIAANGVFYTGNGGTYISSNGDTRINGSSATAPYTQFTVKGAVSQTGNLQDWENSSGTLLSSISAAGLIRVNNTNTDAMITATGNSTYDAFRFRNAGGLFLWGGGANNNIFYANSGSIALTGGNWVSGRLSVDTGSTSSIGIVVRGQASQTANLQEWQNSAGTVVSYINADGNTFATSAVVASYITSSGANSPYFDMSVATSNTITLVQRTAAAVGLIVKGAASQTANLQEWQNVGGTVLAKITASGALDVTAITVNGAAITSTPTTSDVELMNIMGAY